MARPAARSGPNRGAASPSPATRWWQSTWALALAGGVLLWAALPPLSWGLLAWIAPVPWIALVRRAKLDGRRPYTAIWLASLAFWLAALYWLTLPHWATSFGWLAGCMYLALYLPIFIGLSRVGVHTLRLSPIVVAPIVWTGLELARGHLLSGFGMALLSHTHYRWPIVLQISDIGGAYAVSFAIMLAAACVGRMLPVGGARWTWWPVVPLMATLAGLLAYGYWRTGGPVGRPGPKVALIQGSIDIEMKHEPELLQRIFDEYFDLSRQAVGEHPDVELVVWPETMFPYPWFLFDKDYKPPADATWTTDEAEARSREAVGNTAQALRAPLLLGIATVHETARGTDHYNTALFVDCDGRVLDRYDKNHLVMFGEYVPFAEYLPWLYRFSPLPHGSLHGEGARSVRIGDTRYAANICYENTVPHLVRRQVLELRDKGQEPDVLVTLTNDGWFWGSSELDMHLACGVFRAIESRKPCLIAANTGFSAWIDTTGNVRAKGPRRARGIVIATPELDSRGSWYLDHGDILGGACLAGVGILAVVGLSQRFGVRRQPPQPAIA
jgi:apolipoprotein N-acyltransferase